MTSPEPTVRPRRSRWRPLVAVALFAATAIAALVWWGWPQRRDAPLDREWSAVVATLAGDGIAEWRDGNIVHARFADPFDVAIAPDGTIFVSDGVAHRIRALRPDGTVTTIAGGERGFADGPAAEARFDTPSGLALDASGTLYVADTGNNAIRRISADRVVSTVAGGGDAGDVDGPPGQARFNGPLDVAADASGRLVVADTYNDRLRAIAPDGTVTTIAGLAAPGFVDGPAAYAQFDTPAAIAVDRSGRLLVADTGNGAVRTVDASGSVATFAGATLEGLVRPAGIAVSPGGNIYVTDDRGRIVEIAPDGVSSRTVAGSSPGFKDGAGQDARFRRPVGVAVAGDGRLIVADAGNALVRLVAARDRQELRAPPSPLIAPRFDARTFGLLPLLWPAFPMDGPHEVAGTMGEARGSEGSERFHAGLDVRVELGTPVLSVRDGVVTAPVATGDFGSLNEWLRIGPLGYVHVRAGRTHDGTLVDTSRFVPTHDETGKVVRMRVRRGARFQTGETIATANPFNHVHLNIGWPGEEHNPLLFRLPQFEDHMAPSIARGGIRLYDEAGQPIKQRQRGRLLVAGRVHIVVDAWDQADGNRPGRRLGVYGVGYEVLTRDGSAVADATARNIQFDQLSLGPDAARLVYAPGSGIPFYGRRVTRFLYIATNTLRDGAAAAGYWDTTQLAPGDYVLRIVATDIRGNTAVANRDLPVTIALPAAVENSRQ